MKCRAMDSTDEHQRRAADRTTEHPETDEPILLTDGGEDDAKIIGHNTDGSGETYGVLGKVDSSSGYGFYTPDDSKVDGILEAETLSGAVTGGTNITDLVGSNLSISNGTLNASIDDGDSTWSDENGDGLLQPKSGYDGIDISATMESKIGADTVDANTVTTGTVDASTLTGGAVTVDSVDAETVSASTDDDSDDTTAVEGHATASDVAAETSGVTGISDADADNDSSPEISPSGVHGKVTGDGVTHGVKGETTSPVGRGVMGFSTTESFEHSSFTNTAAGVMGVTDKNGDETGVTEGIAVAGNSVAESGDSYGVLGRNESPDGAAVIGNAVHTDGTAVFANGDSYTSGDHTVEGDADVGGTLSTTELSASKVDVSTDDATDGSRAIHGEATDTSSENFGVVGKTASNHNDAAGVLGVAEATGGSIYPMGVKGVAEDGIAMHALHNATDGFSVGLFALTHSDSGQAIQANADADSGETSGVYGRSGSPDGHGVRGRGEGGSGDSIGVLGQTESPEGYGVYSEADTRSDGLIEAGDGVVHEQRGEPTTSELADGDVMTYNSDGSDSHSAGDLVYAINDGGSILTQAIVERSGAS